MSKAVIAVIAAVALAVLSPSSHAAVSAAVAAQDPKYCLDHAEDPRCAIVPESITFSPQGEGTASQDFTPPPVGGGGGGVDIDHIINTALKIWDIIVKNKPVVDIKTQYAVALPQGITSWGQLANWQPPQGEVYGFYAKNGFGTKAIDVRYLVTRIYGGSYQGKGKYLTGVTIEPLNVDVIWGYKFSLSAEVPPETIGNFGTDADPVAGMNLRLKWTIETPIQSASSTALYFLKGDGTFMEDGSPFPHAMTANAQSVLEKASGVSLQ